MKLFFSLFITITVIQNSYAQNFDINTLKSINKNETTFKNIYFNFCVSSVSVLSIGSPAIVFGTGLLRHDKKLQREGLFMAGAFAMNIVITQSTKLIINRKRPFETYSFIVKRVDESDGHSFPSGHTSLAFCTATSLSLRFPKWYVIAPSYLWAASVGWGRMYQGVHYPSDVITGAVIGTASAWLSFYLQNKLNKKNQVHSPQ